MKKTILLSLLFCLAISSQAVAITINFGDNSNNWPGWGTATENGIDTIGIPDFIGGSLVLREGFLDSITFNYTGSTTLGWNLLQPGDFFVDVGANGTWDWVIKPGETTSVYNFSTSPIPLNSSTGYWITGVDNVSPWAGYNIRNSHPYAILTQESPFGTADFSGWQSLTTPGQSLSSTFDGLSIPVGSDSFIISWTVNCANDVVYETIQPVPEPSTLFFLVSGLLGALFFRRKFPKADK